MELLNRIIVFIENSEDTDLLKYMGVFCASFFVIFGASIYLHHRSMSHYRQELERLQKQRTQTRKILTDAQLVNQERSNVEHILAQNKDFRIGQKYQDILQNLGLSIAQQSVPTPTTGETINDKTEVLITSHLNNITMKQLTDLLSAIADVQQLYPKDLVIKKRPNAQSVDVELTIATLETAHTIE